MLDVNIKMCVLHVVLYNIKTRLNEIMAFSTFRELITINE